MNSDKINTRKEINNMNTEKKGRIPIGYKMDTIPFVAINKRFSDERGYFEEYYNEKAFKEELMKDCDIDFNIRGFIQANISKSKRGTVRGLHFQYKYPQSKFLKVIKGKIIDVVVDIRHDNFSFGSVHVFHIDDTDNMRLFVPKGFAHGFIALEDDTIVQYLIDDYWYPNDESGILYNDEELQIDWEGLSGIPSSEFIVSEKDKNNQTFKKFRQSIATGLYNRINTIDNELEEEYNEYGETSFAAQLEAEKERIEDHIVSLDEFNRYKIYECKNCEFYYKSENELIWDVEAGKYRCPKCNTLMNDYMKGE